MDGELMCANYEHITYNNKQIHIQHALIKAYVKTFDSVKCTNVSVKCQAWVLLK